MKDAINRCVECCKFCKWEDLTETHFTPDHEDGSGCHGEEQEFTCNKCLENKESFEEALKLGLAYKLIIE